MRATRSRDAPRRSRDGQADTEFTNYDLRITIAYDFTPQVRICNPPVIRKS